MAERAEGQGKPLDLKTIDNELCTIAHLWYSFGLQLGIQDHVLRRIECDHRDDVRRRLSEVVKFWLGNFRETSWTTLGSALHRIGAHQLAARVCQYDIQEGVSGEGQMGALSTPPQYQEDVVYHTPQPSLEHPSLHGAGALYPPQQPPHPLVDLGMYQGGMPGWSMGPTFNVHRFPQTGRHQPMALPQQPYHSCHSYLSNNTNINQTGSAPSTEQSSVLLTAAGHHQHQWRQGLQGSQPPLYHPPYHSPSPAISLHSRTPSPVYIYDHSQSSAPATPQSQPSASIYHHSSIVSQHHATWDTSGTTDNDLAPPPSKVPRLDQPEGVTLASCRQKLEDFYLEQPEVPEGTWPPVGRTKHITLALIKPGKEINFGSDFARGTIQGSIDDIMKKKEEVSYDEVFSDLEDGARVLFEGRPGCGKTTLMQKVSRDWSFRKLLQAYHLLMVHLRVFGSRADVTLRDLLRAVNAGFTPEEIELLARCVEKDGGKDFVFVLDGLDEYDPGKKGKSDNFIFKLIKGEVLPEAIVIVASRPAATQKFRRDATKCVEVLGFLKPQIEEYIRSYFEKQKEMAEGLILYLDQHPNILHMSYLPLHTVMICFLYECEGSNLPTTETQIYLHFTVSTLLRSLRKARGTQADDEDQPFLLNSFNELDEEPRALFLKICNLAFFATTSSKQVFSYSDVQEFFKDKCGSTGNNKSTLGLIVVNRYFVKFGLDEVYTFLHLTFQEYLAAYHISQQTSCEQHQIIEDYGTEKRLSQVWKFYCGMATFSDTQSLENLELLLSLSGPLLRLQCAYESQNDNACSYIMKSQDGKVSLKESLSPTDCTALGYLLTKAEQSSTPCIELSLSCRIGPEGLDALVKETGESIHHLETFSFHGTEVKSSMDEDFSKFLKKLTSITTLDLSQCKMRKRTLSLLESQSSISKSVSTLNLQDNPLGAQSKSVVLSILENLPNLKTVDLPWDRLGDSFLLKCLVKKKPWSAVAVTVCASDSWRNKTSINLNGNRIGDVGAQSLAEALPHCANLQELDLDFNSIGDAGAQSLAEALPHCANLQTLDLRYNSIGGAGAQSLAEALPRCANLQTLYLDKNSIGAAGAQSLTEALPRCANLQRLFLRYNNLTESGKAVLRKAQEERNSNSELSKIDIQLTS